MKIDVDIFQEIKDVIDALITCRVACDGILLAKVGKYNQLVALINLVETNNENKQRAI